MSASMPANGGFKSSRAWSSKDNCIVLIFLAFFAGILLIIKPQGDFPLNDDWAYILPVEWLVKQGKLRLTDWQFMTLIGQVYLGAASSAIFGFSITGLRLIVIALAALCVILVYAIARLANTPRAWALAMAGLLLCNPIFLITSASFMTDTPFLACCLLAILFFLLWQEKSSTIFGILAWLCVFYACSIRQSGVALAIGFSCFLTLRIGFRQRLLFVALLPTCLLLACLVAYPMVVDRTIGLPSMYTQPTQEAKAFIAGVFNLKLGYLWMAAKVALTALFYLGFCTVPLLPMVLTIGWRSEPPKVWLGVVSSIVLALIFTVALVAFGHTTPVTGNTLFDFGLGVRTLQNDGPIERLPRQAWWAAAFLAALSVVCTMRVASLVWTDIRRADDPEKLQAAYAVMFAAILLIYNLPFLTRGGIWFDRYALPNLALFCLLTAPFLGKRSLQRSRVALAWSLMGLFLILSVLGTHDYLEWNRKRWEAVAELAQTRGLTFTNIDAGFEYNNYKPRQNGDRRRTTDQVILTNPMAEYRIAFSPLPHHTVLKVIECRTWLYGSPSEIFVLRADPKLSGE